MKKSFLLILTLGLISTTCTWAQWAPAGDKIKTEWAAKITPDNVWPEYPRPIMERTEWQNLNGLWDYAIRTKGQAQPSSFDGKILVPFCVESSLSGVQKTVGEDNELWYRREFKIPAKWNGQKILLHFGAVDWKADVWVNDIKVGTHTGGYTPFNFDITPYIDAKQTSHKLVVRVWDPTDRGPQARGKQVTRPEGIWYTPVTGIWQTVWLEPVAANYIAGTKVTPNIDANVMNVSVYTANNQTNEIAEIKVLDKGKLVASAKTVAGQEAQLVIPSPKLWSPDSPFLYDLEITLTVNGKQTDKVKSYCAMRKVSTKRDTDGIYRIQLNNKDVFQFGPLDQGWWPDGLYTAPTDEALAYDIIKTKEWGFNMIRKHVKVEPARWYTHCDRLGMLVWQDMPNGDNLGHGWRSDRFVTVPEPVRSAFSEETYRKEWREIMDFCHNYPSITTWVPFNEFWGQFKTEEIVTWTKRHDPSRLVNPASGGNHYHIGDMIDVHHYPEPRMLLYDDKRACVMGEYGGIGLVLQDHLWVKDRNWGYVQFKNVDEVTGEYEKYARMLKALITRGISAGVYTQTTDVEGEVNGIMTYDRKVMKMDVPRINKINQEVINTLGR